MLASSDDHLPLNLVKGDGLDDIHRFFRKQVVEMVVFNPKASNRPPHGPFGELNLAVGQGDTRPPNLDADIIDTGFFQNMTDIQASKTHTIRVNLQGRDSGGRSELQFALPPSQDTDRGGDDEGGFEYKFLSPKVEDSVFRTLEKI
jgi:hypothetical protein